MENQAKDFDRWNEIKKNIEIRKRKILKIKIGQVWWCNLGLNIGSEQDGSGNSFERPVLIIGIFSKNTILTLPLSSKNKTGKYYFILNKNSTILLRQPRLLDTKRLDRELKNFKISRKKLKIIVAKYKKLF